MTMKKMKNFMALLLALMMTMSLVACGNKTSEETKTGEEIGCYVQTTETGEKVLVDKDGKAVTDSRWMRTAMCWMRMAMWSSRRRISPLMSSSPET